MSYVRPAASDKRIKEIQSLYREKYEVELTYEEAKVLLEGVMRMVYLTEWMPRLEEAQRAKEAQGGDVSHGNEPSLDGGSSSPERMPT